MVVANADEAQQGKGDMISVLLGFALLHAASAMATAFVLWRSIPRSILTGLLYFVSSSVGLFVWYGLGYGGVYLVEQAVGPLSSTRDVCHLVGMVGVVVCGVWMLPRVPASLLQSYVKEREEKQQQELAASMERLLEKYEVEL